MPGGSNKLKQLRWKIRYPLWGIDEGLKTIGRLHDWSLHFKKTPEEAKKLLDQGDMLRKAIDKVIKSSYINGRPPSII